MYPPDLSQQAIDFALSGNWKEAIKVNLVLLKDNSKDIDTLNRLGRAYLETGQKSKSEETYKKVLRLDKFNSIAAKNLGLLKTSRISHQSKTFSAQAMPLFLEEPGRTRTVSLVDPSDKRVAEHYCPGGAVEYYECQNSCAYGTCVR